MAQTPEGQRLLEEQRQRSMRSRRQADVRGVSPESNPYFGENPFDPNSYDPTVDPQAAEPIPTGRFADPRFDSPEAAARATEVQEFRQDPDQYVDDNKLNIVNEQSLLDNAKSLMSRLFDYEDDPDLEIFGVPLAPVESVWDNTLRYLTGFYDVVNVGIGGLISAAPGGIRTLSGEELSGGKSFLEVLSGEMDPDDAPSPGQIAIASIGKEAARIRNGEGRLTDVLLANPATGPFILAALAADTSPVQKKDFDIMDKEQRTKAFGQGWEQWMSGFTDAGLAFADPLIVAGIGTKVARAGALGTKMTPRNKQALEQALDEAVDLVDEVNFGQVQSRQRVDELISSADERIAETPAQHLKNIENNAPVNPPDTEFLPRLQPGIAADSVDYQGNFFARLLHQVTETDMDGNKVMSADQISKQFLGAKASTRRSDIATLLYQSQTPAEAALILQTLSGSHAAQQKLARLAPALADHAFRIRRDEIGSLIAMSSDQQKAITSTLGKMKENVDQRIKEIDDRLEELGTETAGQQEIGVNLRKNRDTLAAQQENLRSTLDAIDELDQVAKGRTVDHMDPNSPNYDANVARQIVDDLTKREGFYERAVDSRLVGSEVGNRFWLPAKNNIYSRSVMRSRERRGKAGYQYAREGAGIFPTKSIVGYDDAAKQPIYESTGWFSESIFPETSRLRRAVRVWRWLGSETPNGFVGLKGTATVGAEREVDAALNMDLFKGDGRLVTIDGEEVLVGGNAKREELVGRFMSALNDESQDSYVALKQLEDEVAEELYKSYFAVFDAKDRTARKGMQEMINRIRRSKDNLEAQLKEGYWVDEAGDLHEVPYLDTQLANGTYMLPFQDIEKQLQREARSSAGIGKVHERLATSGYYISRFDETFQSLWRPATLLRASYVQRNTFEGVMRAAAYQASLAPFTWPVRGTYNGVRNAINTRITNKRAEVAEQALGEVASVQAERRALNQARKDQHFLKNAIPARVVDDEVVEWRVFDENNEFRVVSQDELNTEIDSVATRVQTQEQRLKAEVKDKFDASVQGTKFGKWRDKQIEAIKERQRENQSFLDAYLTEAGDGLDDDVLRRLDDDDVGRLAEIIRSDLYEELQLEILEYDPARALAAYRTIAGRQKRIGSGTSLGPDGNRYGDAFFGPLEQINRQLLSADKTTQQRLQVKFDAFSSLLQNVQRRQYQPVAWNQGKNIDAWSTGVAAFIEEASSSVAVRAIVDAGGDTELALSRLQSSGEGQAWIKTISNLFSEDTNMRDVPSGQWTLNPTTRMDPFAEIQREPVTGISITNIDRQNTLLYLDEVKRRVDVSTQRIVTDADGNTSDALYRLLEQRVAEKSRRAEPISDVRDIPETQIAINSDNVKTIIRGLPESMKEKFSPIAGDELINVGMAGPANIYRKVVNRLFNALGTVPEDALVRAPFYNARFKETRNLLIRNYLIETGQEGALRKGRAKDSAGKDMGNSLSHGEARIPSGVLSDIMVNAHRRALSETREYLYTIERRTNLGKYGEYLFPFISASQNSVTVIGKLLYKEPWLAPFIADLWRMPTRVGWEDENGNLQLPMPKNWITKTLSENPNIPVLGGVIDSSDTIVVPKDGFNLFLPETGFGVAPRPAPLVQVSASELMKANFISQETPELLKSTMGEENATDFWKLMQDWVFGEEMGMSSEFASYDRLLPAAYQKLLRSKDELSSQYGYKYTLHWHTQMARYWGRERDTMPTEDEIKKRSTNSLLFDMVGNIGLPTPYTPYPILTRPQVDSPVTLLQDEYRKLQQLDPVNASRNMDMLFGDWALLMANTKITRNIGGADPSPQTISDINTLDSLIRDVTDEIPDDTLDVLGILVNNRNAPGEYEQSAYAWQKSQKIPGTNREWREVQAPMQSVAERQRIAGWTKYRQAMDVIESRMENAGVESMETKAGLPYKMQKKVLVANMSANPDYAGWWVDYQDRGGSNTLAAVKTLEKATQNETFRRLLVENDKPQLLSIMDQYVQQRSNLIDILQSTGKSIEHSDNILFKLGWAKMRQEWKSQDPRWAEIANRYLANDDNPQSPGLMNEQLEAMQVQEEAANG